MFRFFFVPLRGILHTCARTKRYISFFGSSCFSCCPSGCGDRKWSPCLPPLKGDRGVRLLHPWHLWCGLETAPPLPRARRSRPQRHRWIVFRLSYHFPRPLPRCPLDIASPRKRGGGVRLRSRIGCGRYLPSRRGYAPSREG